MIVIMLTAVLLVSISCSAFSTVYAGTDEGNITVTDLPENLYYVYSGGDTVRMDAPPYIEFYLKKQITVDSVTIELQNPASEDWQLIGECFIAASNPFTVWSQVNELPKNVIETNSYEGIGIYNNKLRFCIYMEDGTVEYSDTFEIHFVPDEIYYERIAGNDRYDTAIKIAEEMRVLGNGKWDNVVIACGTNFADALGGTYLAIKNNAPILLVNTSDSVMNRVADEIAKKMEPSGQVFILGGPGAVSQKMESILNDRAGVSLSQIKRFAGSNRYDTNLLILEYCGITDSKGLMFCSGTSFADALSASAVGMPIMLVSKRLTANQQDYLNILNKDNREILWYIIGGPGAVSEELGRDLMMIRQVQIPYRRIEGSDRFATSRAIANEFFEKSNGGAPYTTNYDLVLAYGRNFPDGLAGGVLAYQLNAPLFLVDNKNYAHAGSHRFYYGEFRAFVLGGPSLISDETTNWIMHCTWDDLERIFGM